MARDTRLVQFVGLGRSADSSSNSCPRVEADRERSDSSLSWTVVRSISVAVLFAAVSACSAPAVRAVDEADAYVEANAVRLTESGLELDAFREYVLTLCRTLATSVIPDQYLVREAGPDYWAWSDDPEPTDGRNSPDEPIKIARDACNYDIGEALVLGINYYSGVVTTAARPPSDPLDQMEIAFLGGYSRSEIKLRIDEAMTLYGMPITEENYSRAGSVLVTLRQEYGPTEMDILDYMIRSHVPGVDLSFNEAAAFAVVFLAAGDS